MAKYAGLTDDPKTRKEQHGNPSDWWQTSFSNEKDARAWEKQKHDSGYEGSSGGSGWKFGYTYTITKDTKE